MAFERQVPISALYSYSKPTMVVFKRLEHCVSFARGENGWDFIKAREVRPVLIVIEKFCKHRDYFNLRRYKQHWKDKSLAGICVNTTWRVNTIFSDNK